MDNSMETAVAASATSREAQRKLAGTNSRKIPASRGQPMM